ncbi:MAG: HlyD family efflux transporter periplasmic adaptor subunit, partial [Oscillospiraceae bacterium]
MKIDNKQKKHKLNHLIIFIVLLLPIIYILFQLCFVFFTKPFRTQTVIKYNLPDTVTANSIICMTQEDIQFNGGVTSYIVKDGERVSAGTTVAQVFDSANQAQCKHREERLYDEIALLKTAQSSKIGVNIETLLNQKLNEAFNVMELIDARHYEGLGKAKTDLQLAENKLQIATDKASDFTQRIDELTIKMNAESAAAGEATNVTAPTAGYFVSAQSGSKQAYTQEQLNEMSASEIKDAANAENVPNDENIVGKLISDYRWKCYFTVDIKQSEKFVVNQTVNMSFSEVSDMRLPAKVLEINKDSTGELVKIVLGCDYMNSEVIALQNAKVTVTFKEYEGLRVDKAALRVINGNYGVYVKYGNIAKYRKI